MKFLVKFIGYLFGIGTVMFLIGAAGAWVYISRLDGQLPDYKALKDYEPPVMTRFHASDGSLMAEYAKERRLFLPIQAIPDRLKHAFISAEDKNFYEHPGIDFQGVLRAILINIENHGSGRRLVGASTITQQVAKNFLLTNEVSFDRKIKEAVLALKIEQAFTKDQILELYLNEIYLGMGSYGVGAAALVYFDKSVQELTLDEAAYLASLPKGPNNYNPFRHPDRAIERRNWVIDRMVENGYATAQEGEAAKARPLDVTTRHQGSQLFAADYFTEDVRREVSDIYGEDKLYEGGLSVRTSLDPKLQRYARRALMNGLIAFDERKAKWRGPVSTISAASNWGAELGKIKPLSDVPEWTLAVVLSLSNNDATIGLRPEENEAGQLSPDRKTATLTPASMSWVHVKGHKVRDVADVLKVGDVVYVEKAKSGNTSYELHQVPEVSGAMVAMDPYTGRVLAMVGGFSYDASQFNRATQAYRQPGSSFKPIVYSAALDNGYTPSSVVLDAPIEISQGPGLGTWKPQNYGGKFYGPSTLRTGIEHSRNVMTVRLAQDMGMPLVAEYARRFGVYDHMKPVLSMALGAGETTLMRMVTAYSTIANGGRKITPTLIDRIQDRYGRTIFRHDSRICIDCSEPDYHGQPQPKIIDDREQVLDPMTAYQITSMMEGVVQRGTGSKVKAILGSRPVAGKTGTTNDEKDAWFIGFTPNLVAGVYMGYDQPKSMGAASTGGMIAAPIFGHFMEKALAGTPPVEFRIPKGLKLIPIDRRTGLRAEAGAPDSIMEAFKPGTQPPESYSVIGYGDEIGEKRDVSPEAGQAVMTGTGGLY